MSIVKQRPLGAIICGLAVSFGVGCVDNDTSLFIRHVPIPDPENKCAVSADPTALSLSAGYFDVGLARNYDQVFLVGNQIFPRGDSPRQHPETSRVRFHRAEVELYDNGTLICAAGWATNAASQTACTRVVNPFAVTIAGFVEPASGTTPSYGTLVVSPLIDENVGKAIFAKYTAAGARIVASVKVLGRTLGRLDVGSGFYDFPVTVCGDPGDTMAMRPKRSCIPSSFPTKCDDPLVSSCILGQDTVHDCRIVRKLDPSALCTDTSGKGCN